MRVEVCVFGLGRIGVEDRSGQVEVSQDKDCHGRLGTQAWDKIVPG